MKCILSCCVLALLFLVEAQRTVTLTESRTITSTLHFSTNVSCNSNSWIIMIKFMLLLKFACAKLVNVTGRCRQRRGLPVEEPILLMMDEPNWFNHHRPLLQFIHTKTFRYHPQSISQFAPLIDSQFVWNLASRPHLWRYSPIGQLIIPWVFTPWQLSLRRRNYLAATTTASSNLKAFSPSSLTPFTIRLCRPSTSQWQTSLLVRFSFQIVVE